MVTEDKRNEIGNKRRRKSRVAARVAGKRGVKKDLF